jgi:hypothetical protein
MSNENTAASVLRFTFYVLRSYQNRTALSFSVLTPHFKLPLKGVGKSKKE